MFLEAKRRKLRRLADGNVFQVEGVAGQLRQEKPLAEVDQHELAVFGVGDHMQAMGQDKGKGLARERPHSAANVLHSVAAEVDLDLEVFMPMRAGQRRPPALVADVEVGAVAALLHAVGGNAGAWHNGLSGGRVTTLASSLAEGELQLADALDARRDHIARLQGTDTCGGAGEDQVARLQRDRL